MRGGGRHGRPCCRSGAGSSGRRSRPAPAGMQAARPPCDDGACAHATAPPALGGHAGRACGSGFCNAPVCTPVHLLTPCPVPPVSRMLAAAWPFCGCTAGRLLLSVVSCMGTARASRLRNGSVQMGRQLRSNGQHGGLPAGEAAQHCTRDILVLRDRVWWPLRAVKNVYTDSLSVFCHQALVGQQCCHGLRGLARQ